MIHANSYVRRAPGVAPLRTFCHCRVCIFALFPWPRSQFRIWLTVGYPAIAIAIAWHSHTGGGAWPGLVSKSMTTSMKNAKMIRGPGQAPPPVWLCHAMAITITVWPTVSRIQNCGYGHGNNPQMQTPPWQKVLRGATPGALYRG